MTRRTLLKLIGLLPLVGPTISKALINSNLKSALPNGPYLPAYFPKWNKATDGLEDAAKWALAIERSRLPDNMVFPRVGQIWEAVRDCEVDFVPCPARLLWVRPPDLSLMANLAMCPRAQLQLGEMVRVVSVDDVKPIFVTLLPVRYHELHQHIVPQEIRNLPGYLGYELKVKTAKTIPVFDKESRQTYFSESFRLIEDVV